MSVNQNRKGPLAHVTISIVPSWTCSRLPITKYCKNIFMAILSVALC